MRECRALLFGFVVLGDPQRRLKHGGFDDLQLDVLPDQFLLGFALSK